MAGRKTNRESAAQSKCAPRTHGLFRLTVESVAVKIRASLVPGFREADEIELREIERRRGGGRRTS